MEDVEIIVVEVGRPVRDGMAVVLEEEAVVVALAVDSPVGVAVSVAAEAADPGEKISHHLINLLWEFEFISPIFALL